MTTQGLFLCLFGCGLLAACGGGPGTSEPPAIGEQRPPVGEQRPTSDSQDPPIAKQRPTENAQRPPGNAQDPASPSASSTPVKAPEPKPGDDNRDGGPPGRQ
jgi:hypothetical protein